MSRSCPARVHGDSERMSHITRSFIASGAVLLSVGVVLGGNLRRSQVDQGAIPSVGQIASPSGSEAGDLLASKGNQIPEVNYYESVAELLKSEYVDPVTDDGKLVAGAIKGMVASLNDPNCTFMDPKEFKAFTNARTGNYEGIGAEMILTTDPQDKPQPNAASDDEDPVADPTGGIRIPRLVVALVVPGGPADRAGVKVGDWVDSLDGKWVVNGAPFRRLAQLQLRVQKGKATVQDLNHLRQELRLKARASTIPGRAKDKLTIGTSGSVSVKWMRGQTLFTTQIDKESCRLPNILGGSTDGPVRLRFVPGEAARLKQAVAHKAQVVLDLRGNVMGDFKSMKDCLAVVAPPGSYGFVEREQVPREAPMDIKEGNPRAPQISLLVDSSTRNAAEIFALALSAKGRAKLSGTAMAGDRSITEVVALPDGGGYTLVKGRFSITHAKSASRPRRTAFAGPPLLRGGVRVAWLGSSRRRAA